MASSPPPTASRRAFLGTGGSFVVSGLVGCLGAQTSVTVLAAGSLAQALDRHIAPRFESTHDVGFHGEYYGSNAVMRMIEDRTKHPDVVISADEALLRDRLYDRFVDWDVEIANNVLGIGYDPETPLGARIEAGDSWFEVLPASDAGDVVIGDADLDPLGYRTWQAFELAERTHGLSGFRERVGSIVYEEPDEPQIMAGVSTGARAAGVVYQNMARDHGMPFIAFPPAYNFANPALACWYATATYTTEGDGYTARGRPIMYSATTLDRADAHTSGVQFLQFLIDRPNLLKRAGLGVSDQLPRGHGNVPGEIAI